MNASDRWSPTVVGRAFDGVAAAHVAFVEGTSLSDLDRWIRGVLQAEVDVVAGGSVLDLGAGGGTFAAIAARAAGSVHLVDASAVMLDLASARLAAIEGCTLRLTCGDARQVVASEQEDQALVLMIGELLSYVPSPLGLLCEVRERLAPGARVIGTFIRRSGISARLEAGEILDDDGDVLVFRERSSDDDVGVPELWARAWSDRAFASLLEGAGLRIDRIWLRTESTCGGFVATSAIDG